MERRRNARVDINLRCRISSPRAGHLSLMAVTENMSRGDILVLFDREQPDELVPSPGDPLIVEIDLPAEHAFGRKCMQCQTTVVRVTKAEDGGSRAALRIHKIRFQSREGCPAAGVEEPGARSLVM
jgi:c-di-GMP-binding flagellar brake protein YcgR